MADSISRLAPAKINLALHVIGRREDGYHLIDSLVAFANFGDRLTVSEAETDAFIVTGHYAPMVPIDGGNLVLAARDLLREQFAGSEMAPVRIVLEKNLPVASGVGGGSSDAAAAIRALAALWNIDPDMDALATKSLPFGADIPMCLAGKPLRAGGVGDVLKPLTTFPDLHAVLANPGLPVSTPDVFRALTKRDNAALPAPPDFENTTALAKYLAGARNDLQAAAIELCPMIAEALDTLTEYGAELSRMSGSGGTCFGLFGNESAAARAAERIGKKQPGWFVQACGIAGTGND